jgi:hypothetical protein
MEINQNSVENLPFANSLQQISEEVFVPLNAGEEKRNRSGFYVLENKGWSVNVIEKNIKEIHGSSLIAWARKAESFDHMIMLAAVNSPVLTESNLSEAQVRHLLYVGAQSRISFLKNSLAEKSLLGEENVLLKNVSDEKKLATLQGLEAFQQKLLAR